MPKWPSIWVTPGTAPSAMKPATSATDGHSAKTLCGDFGQVDLAVPRDRDASFTPPRLPKHQRRVPGFDERILSL